MEKISVVLPRGKMCEKTYHAECVFYNARKTDSDGWGYCEKLGDIKILLKQEELLEDTVI